MTRRDPHETSRAVPNREPAVTPVSNPKPVEWVTAARDDLRKMAPEVQRELGLTLMAVQFGENPSGVSPFEGSRGGNVLKISENLEGDTYRLVYAAKFEKAIYVLHVFKKKSTSGIATPQKEIDTVWKRFKVAEEAYRLKYESDPG